MSAPECHRKHFCQLNMHQNSLRLGFVPDLIGEVYNTSRAMAAPGHEGRKVISRSLRSWSRSCTFSSNTFLVVALKTQAANAADCFTVKMKQIKLAVKYGNIFSERELTFTFAICRRPSVCRLSVCLLSVRNVRAPYSYEWNIRQCFYAIW